MTFLKGELARRSWAIDVFVGAESGRRGSGLHWAALWLQIRDESAWISLQKEPRSWHDRAMIRPRSDVDRGPGSRSAAVRSGWSDSAMKDVRSRLDQGAIMARSRLDRTAIVEFFHDLSAPSDVEHLAMKITTVRWRSDIPDVSTRCFWSRRITTVHAASNDL